jgi:DNA-binding CsgD family transcriptional regulator
MKGFLLFMALTYIVLNVIGIGLVTAQTEIAGSMTPLIRNFRNEEYNAAHQNWSVAQDNERILYFGNNNGLLEFNGYGWNLYSSKEPNIIRSVYADNDGRIYSGSYEEFGYWKRDKFGQLTYKSISSEFIDPKDLTNITIWQIKRIGKYIFFHSFEKIFVYEGSEIIKTIDPRIQISSFFEFQGKPYAFLRETGLFLVNDELQLQKQPIPDFVTKMRIINILPVTKNISMVITEHHGILLRNNNQWDHLKLHGYPPVTDLHINKAMKIQDDQFLIGTLGNGLLLINSNGQILMNLNRISGLQSNNVYSILKDPDDNIWLGLDSGIDLIEINSPFLFFEDKSGELGSVSSFLYHNNKLYVGTNNGLYFAEWIKGAPMVNISFRSMPELRGHVLSLQLMDESIICGFNTGTYIIDNHNPKQISNIGGGNLVSHNFQNKAYQGIYTGLALYEKNHDLGRWQFKHVLKDLDYIAFVEMDHLGNLWSSSRYKGLYMHKLNNSGDTILNTKGFGTEDGFISEYFMFVFKFDNRLVFSNGGMFFTYDYFEHKIVPYIWLNNQLGKFRDAHFVYNPDPDEYWFINKSSLGLFRLFNESLSMEFEINYNLINRSLPDFNQNITKLDDQYYLIGFNNGFAIFDYNLSENVSSNRPKNLRINAINSFNKSGIQNQIEISDSIIVNLPFSFRNIYLNFSVPGRSQENLNFYYRLSGQEYWNNLGSTNELRYFNMKWGLHVIEIKAIDHFTGITSIINYPVNISSPWFLHWIAISIYAIFLIFLGLIIIRINSILIDRKTEESRKKIIAESEEKMHKTKNEFLQAALKNKSRELVNYTVLLSKRNEILHQIRFGIVEMIDSKEVSNTRNLKNLIKIIDNNLSDRKEWMIFKSHFDSAHSDFIEILRKLHSNLTPTDLRFCAFLKMNLSSKEIATLLMISARGVEVKRYRLRKKLGLNKDQNLIKYLMEI